MKRKLTPKQRKFADEYIETGNATQSAIKAGYSENYAKAQSSKMLENVGIKKYIDERLEEIKSSKVATQQEILEFLTRLMRREEKEEVVVTLKKPTTIQMMSEDGKKYTKSVYEDVDDIIETKTKNADAIKAVDILTRILGISKGYDASLSEAQTRKASAEANIAESKAKIVDAQAKALLGDGEDIQDDGFLDAIKRAEDNIWDGDDDEED